MHARRNVKGTDSHFVANGSSIGRHHRGEFINIEIYRHLQPNSVELAKLLVATIFISTCAHHGCVRYRVLDEAFS